MGSLGWINSIYMISNQEKTIPFSDKLFVEQPSGTNEVRKLRSHCIAMLINVTLLLLYSEMREH